MENRSIPEITSIYYHPHDIKLANSAMGVKGIASPQAVSRRCSSWLVIKCEHIMLMLIYYINMIMLTKPVDQDRGSGADRTLTIR